MAHPFISFTLSSHLEGEHLKDELGELRREEAQVKVRTVKPDDIQRPLDHRNDEMIVLQRVHVN